MSSRKQSRPQPIIVAVGIAVESHLTAGGWRLGP